VTSLSEAMAIVEQIVDKESKAQSNSEEIQDAWYIIKNNLRG
jgi:hypothetical protein|tara:strand:+ start:1321 stop:1446 length:126 start_codon:yes stop_codon:yes gene_type:complete